MSLIQTFTDSIPKGNLTFFCDFIGSVSPFGILRTNNQIGTPSDSYSNENAAELGTVSCTLATGTSGAAYQRIGIYQNASVSGAFPARQWDIRNGEYSIECRLKTSVHPSASCYVTCGYSVNGNAAPSTGAYFYHTNGHSTWRAAVSVSGSMLKEVDTGVPVASMSVLRVVSTNRSRKIEFFANGFRILKWVGDSIFNAAADGDYAMPCIEIRDATAGGGQRANSFTADYMMTEERFQR